MQIWLSDLNGNTGLNSDTLNYSFKCYTNSVKRVVLHEVFSASSCPPCKPGNTALKQVLSKLNHEDWTAIKYQMSWPNGGDPYYTAEGNVRRTYYNVSSVPFVNSVSRVLWRRLSSAFGLHIDSDLSVFL